MIIQKQMEANPKQIDSMIQQMNVVKTFYIQQARKKRKSIKISKLSDHSPSPKLSRSVQVQLTPTSPALISNSSPKPPHIFLSTFVNIKQARYHLGPAQSYNLKNIQFPFISPRRSVSPNSNPAKKVKMKANPENLHDFSSQFTQNWQQQQQQQISSSRAVQKMQVKQSWNRYIDMDNIGVGKKGANKNRTGRNWRNSVRDRAKKDRTQENIQGWKSFYHQDEEIQIVKN